MGTAQNTPIHTSGREEMKAQMKKNGENNLRAESLP